MDAHRFDAITRALTARLSRRGAVAGAGAGLAATVAGAARASGARAQEATPAASPRADRPAPPGPGGTERPMLFLQVFQSGAFAPKAGEEGVFTLTLDGGTGQTVYFSDRPERDVGVVSTEAFIDAIDFTPANPPNAALVARTADVDGEEVIVVELFNPTADDEAGTVTYEASVLADYTEEALGPLVERQLDASMSETFETAHLFIDGCGRGMCWDGSVAQCVSCQCFQLGVQGCPCASGTRQPCYDPSMQCETNPGSPPGSTGACWYP